MQEFNNFYNNTIRNTLKVLEVNRLDKLKNYRLLQIGQIFIFLAESVVVILWLVALLNSHKFLYISVCALFVFIFLGIKKNNISKEYSLNMKFPTLKRVLAEWCECVQLRVKNAKNIRNFLCIVEGLNKTSKTIDFECKSFLHGAYEGRKVDFYLATNKIKKTFDVPIEERSQFGDILSGVINKIYDYFSVHCYNYMLAALFEGVKKFEGVLIILPRNTTNIYLRKFYGNLKKMNVSQFGFDDTYDVYTNNIDAAGRLFGSDFSVFLSEQKNLFGKKLSIIIDDNKITEILSSKKQFCFFDIKEEVDNSGRFLDMAENTKLLFVLSNTIKNNL